MKKLTYFTAAALTAAVFASCGNSVPRADLKNEIDTLSYSMGLANSQGIKEYLSGRLGIDTAYVDEFIKGVNDGANAGDDKRKAAYYAGLQIGQQISNQMIPGLNQEVFGDDSTKTISLKNFMAGFVSGTTGKKQLMTPEEARNIAESKMTAIRESAMLKQFGAYKAQCEKWLAENAKKEGVKTTGSGLQYRVIKEGKGEMPKDTSMVTVHYEGKLIDGETFDSSYKRGEPAQFIVNQVIPGWKEALVNMHEGDVWEVYVPQELAYGMQQQGKIKPFSTLIFKVELLSANRKPETKK